jgi:hypothetical protein
MLGYMSKHGVAACFYCRSVMSHSIPPQGLWLTGEETGLHSYMEIMVQRGCPHLVRNVPSNSSSPTSLHTEVVYQAPLSSCLYRQWTKATVF